MKSFLTLLLPVALLFAGCAVGPNYSAPDLQLPEQFPNIHEAEVGKEQTVKWWASFNDTLLTSLVERSVATNNDLKVSLARLNEARALRREENLQLLPSFDVSAGFSSTRLGAGQAPGLPREARRIDVYDAGFDMAWELDFFGGERRAIEARTAEEDAAVADLNNVLTSVIAELSRNYFELRGLQQRLAVAKQNVDSQRQTVEITKARFNWGDVTELDSAQAEAQLKSTIATIPTLEAALEARKRRIAVLLGANPSDLVAELSALQAIPEFQGPVTISAPAELLRRRPDVIGAERRLAAATAGIGVAVSEFFPKVYFNGSLSVEAKNLGGLSEPGSEAFTFGPRITWSGLNVRETLARIDAADARAQAAGASYEQSVLLALEEVENSLVNFSKERERRLALEDAFKSGQRALDLARSQYKLGETDLISVLNAQLSLFQIQTQLEEAKSNVLTSLVALYKSLGGGWEAFTLAASN